MSNENSLRINVVSNTKDYENVALRHDPAYFNVDQFTEPLREFISEKGLIIYGGMAIDYALRLHGDKIYPDDLLQVDYDFFSPNNIADAYELAEIFLDIATKVDGNTEGIRAISGSHFKTMRVDIGDNHFLADITFVPARLFAAIPTLQYKGIKIVHPDFQRLDIHHALAFPYDGPPTEVLPFRWKKDLTRFQLLDKYYPITGDGLGEGPPTAKVSHALFPEYVLAGFSAYYAVIAELEKRHGELPPLIAVEPTERVLEIVHSKPAKAVETISLTHTRRYNATMEMIPEVTYGMSANGPVRIYSTEDSLLSVVSFEAEKHQRIASAQYLAHGFLAHYHLAKMVAQSDKSSTRVYTPAESADVYLAHYINVMRLIQWEDELVPLDAIPLTGLSTEVYGSDNISTTKKIGLSRIAADQGTGTVPTLPQNYYPSRSRANGRARPTFDTSTSELFAEGGEMVGAAPIATTSEN